jgi:hypothetical protein
MGSPPPPTPILTCNARASPRFAARSAGSLRNPPLRLAPAWHPACYSLRRPGVAPLPYTRAPEAGPTLNAKLFHGTWSRALGRHRGTLAYRGTSRLRGPWRPRSRRSASPAGSRTCLRNFRKFAGPVPLSAGLDPGTGSPSRSTTACPRGCSTGASPRTSRCTRHARLPWAFDRDGRRSGAWTTRGRASAAPAGPALRAQAARAPRCSRRRCSRPSRPRRATCDALGRRAIPALPRPAVARLRGIVNQFALFSLMSGARPRYCATGSHGTPGMARAVVVPASLKWEVRDRLDQINVTERVLFPGLDGLSALADAVLTLRVCPRAGVARAREGLLAARGRAARGVVDRSLSCGGRLAASRSRPARATVCAPAHRRAAAFRCRSEPVEVSSGRWSACAATDEEAASRSSAPAARGRASAIPPSAGASGRGDRPGARGRAGGGPRLGAVRRGGGRPSRRAACPSAWRTRPRASSRCGAETSRRTPARPRRRAARGARLHALPPLGQPHREPDGAGRVAARGSAAAAPPARRCSTTAFRSTTRSAAGSRGAACRPRRSTAPRWCGAARPSLYGGSALAGVVQLLRRPAGRDVGRRGDLVRQLRDAAGSAFASGASGPWRARVSGEGFRTDGEVAVAPGVGRPGGHPARRHARLGRAARRARARDGGRARLFASGSLYRDSRENGTPLQTNETRLEEARAGGQAPVAGWHGDRARVRKRGALRAELLRDRGGSRDGAPTSLQTVPSTAFGGIGQWSAAFGAHAVAAASRRAT